MPHSNAFRMPQFATEATLFSRREMDGLRIVSGGVSIPVPVGPKLSQTSNRQTVAVTMWHLIPSFESIPARVLLRLNVVAHGRRRNKPCGIGPRAQWRRAFRETRKWRRSEGDMHYTMSG